MTDGCMGAAEMVSYCVGSIARSTDQGPDMPIRRALLAMSVVDTVTKVSRRLNRKIDYLLNIK